MTKKTKQPASNGSHKPTTAAEWRKPREEGMVVQLPSGHFARLRPVALDVLLNSGSIPDMLTPIAAKMMWVEEEPEQIANVAEMATGYSELINIIVPAAMMEPLVVDENPADGEITLDDIEFGDKIAIFNLATAGATTMRKFREQQAQSLAALSDSDQDGDTAV